jgi:predicted dehydrogenase
MKKIALIGVGKMGISHLAIANQTPDIEVAAICDTSMSFIKAITKNTKFIGYTDYKKMIKEVPLDGVMILVPNAYHFEITKYCLERGIHVFVEKPFTLKYSDSKFLVELAINQKVKGQVGYVNRFNPIFQRVKKLLEHNILGEVSDYKNNMTGGVILKKNSSGWRNDYKKGGGCLFDYGPHCFDLSTYLFGTDVQVQSSMLKKVFSTEVDDIVYANLLHNNSIVGLNYINWSDSSVRKATNNIEINGSKGKILASKQELSIFLNEGNEMLNLEKGWNKIYITDENTDVPYYLRGEDFSRQLIEFSKLINDRIEESITSLHSASITDKILEEVKNLNKKLL